MKIIGTGRAHPAKVVTNAMLEQFLDLDIAAEHAACAGDYNNFVLKHTVTSLL